jgi:hypothetical protein
MDARLRCKIRLGGLTSAPSAANPADSMSTLTRHGKNECAYYQADNSARGRMDFSVARKTDQLMQPLAGSGSLGGRPPWLVLA